VVMLSEARLGSLMFCDNGAAHRCDVGVRSAFEHLLLRITSQSGLLHRSAKEVADEAKAAVSFRA
jgi:hypothetical protein